MPPVLRDPALVEHGHHVGVPDGGQPVGDDEHRPPLHEPVQRLLHEVLVLGVQGASWERHTGEQSRQGPARRVHGPALAASHHWGRDRSFSAYDGHLYYEDDKQPGTAARLESIPHRS